jgi:outer membrane protein OmpA-like peptidoglycan-associated protein
MSSLSGPSSSGSRHRSVPVWGAAVTVAVVTFSVLNSGHAQSLSEQQLIEALQGKTSRSMTSGKPAAQQSTAQAKAEEERLNHLMDLLKKRGSRAFSAKERTEVAELTKERPKVDVEIYFAFNSATVAPQAIPTLQQMGKAMTNRAFEGRGFLITGHTDAKGQADVNLALSQRRAEAVKAYLVQHFGITSGRLQVLGYGEERLKNAADPFAGENRRVQIVNLPEGTVTARR